MRIANENYGLMYPHDFDYSENTKIFFNELVYLIDLTSGPSFVCNTNFCTRNQRINDDLNSIDGYEGAGTYVLS